MPLDAPSTPLACTKLFQIVDRRARDHRPERTTAEPGVVETEVKNVIEIETGSRTETRQKITNCGP